MRLSTLLLSATLLSTTALSSALAKDKADQKTSLDEVTVYATKSKQSTFDVPAIVSKVDTTAPGYALAGDIGDLLEFTPGVDVENGPRRNGQTISIRGFDDEAIITLIDGRRQNFESAHDGRFFVDPMLLKSVEVVKGASSAIYGGGAIGGVVAFETKDAADLLKPGQKAGILTSVGYRSANSETSPMAAAYAVSGGWDLLGSVTYRESDDIKQGGGTKLQTEDEVAALLLKAGYTFADYHTIKAQIQNSQNQGQEPNNGAGAITSSNPLVSKDVTDAQYSLKYAYDNPNSVWINPKLHLYHNETTVEEKDLTGSNTGRIQVRDLTTDGFTFDNQFKLAANKDHKHTITKGFEIYRDQQVGTNNRSNVRSGVPNAEQTNYGLFVQDEIALNTSIGQFLATPAVRYDSYESNDEVGNSQDENRFSPKFALTYKPIKELMFFGSWSRAFRAPNLTELYPSGQHYPGNNFIANPNLLPEVVNTKEFGSGIDFKDVFASDDRIKIKGSWFESDADNLISQQIGFNTTQNINVKRAKLTGFEVEAQYDLNPVKAKIGLSEVRAQNLDTKEHISNTVPLTLVSDFSYKADVIDSVVGWRSRFAKRNNRVTSSSKTDGYAVHDLYYRWQPTAKALDSVTLDLGVENIFDKRYQTRFASLSEEGRSYNARITYKW